MGKSAGYPAFLPVGRGGELHFCSADLRIGSPIEKEEQVWHWDIEARFFMWI